MKVNIDVLAAAVVFALGGIAFMFLPVEVATYMGQNATGFMNWALQCLGACYLAMAWLNFTNKNAPMGGIYGRPVLLLNLMIISPSFFFSLDAIHKHPEKPEFILITVVFGVLAAALLFRMMGKGPKVNA